MDPPAPRAPYAPYAPYTPRAPERGGDAAQQAPAARRGAADGGGDAGGAGGRGTGGEASASGGAGRAAWPAADPDPHPDPGPDPDSGSSPDPGPGPDPSPSPGPRPSPGPGSRPSPDPGPRPSPGPDRSPDPDSGSGPRPSSASAPAPVRLRASASTSAAGRFPGGREVPRRLTLYPAIDLRAGRCVRLLQGDPDRQEVFSDDPVAMAQAWVASGARALHVVDLDGAFAGRPLQLDLVRRIVHAVSVPVQVGGGLRTAADVEAVFAAGAARAVVGTRALEGRFFGALLRRFGPAAIIAGLDARGDRVAIQGWQADGGVTLARAAADLRALGCAEAVYTQVQRDGMLGGPDLVGLEVLLTAGLRVVASGGIARVADIRALAGLTARGVTGAILGRALYTGALRLDAALAAAASPGAPPEAAPVS